MQKPATRRGRPCAGSRPPGGANVGSLRQRASSSGRQVREALAVPLAVVELDRAGRRRRPRRRPRPRSAPRSGGPAATGSRSTVATPDRREPRARARRPGSYPRSVSGGSARPSASRCRFASVSPWRDEEDHADAAPAAGRGAGTRRASPRSLSPKRPHAQIADREPGRVEQHEDRDRRDQRVVREVGAEQRPEERHVVQERAGEHEPAHPADRQADEPAPQQPRPADRSPSITTRRAPPTATNSECPYAK